MSSPQNIILLLVLLLSSCTPKFDRSIDGIAVEKVDEVITGTEYTVDNKNYQSGREFIYDYSLLKEGKEYFFKSQNDYANLRDGWDLVEKGDQDSITITQIKMIVLADQGRMSRREGYNESVVEYQYLTNTGVPYYKSLTKIGETTGLIENKRNIWLHPPRGYMFKMTELNPWPYIKFPIKKNEEWTWKLEIGDKWADKRWKVWEGNIVNQCQYRIEGEESIETTRGTILCTKVVGVGISRIGTTKMTAYYNEDKGGFVRVEYVNIDGSQLKMELVELR